MNAINTLTISSALELLREKKISPQELGQACYSQIDRLNPKLNAFITVLDAQDTFNVYSDNNTSSSRSLQGIPIARKDLFDTAGVLTTAGSKFFAENIPQRDAFVVEKLKHAGALFT